MAFTTNIATYLKPLVNLTLATLRNAEFGFFGVVVYTRVHTPLSLWTRF